jgi:hypothetical protein
MAVLIFSLASNKKPPNAVVFYWALAFCLSKKQKPVLLGRPKKHLIDKY